jgi:hypothetical protein
VALGASAASAVAQPPQQPVGPSLGDQADGVRRAGGILGAATAARWPMYLRNVKQILRQAEGGFDERRYGFGGLMDLLKACQREGFVRIERDRRGGLRVFEGAGLQRTGVPQPEPIEVIDGEPVDIEPGNVFPLHEPAETERPGSEPIPIDTTAELLGRAKARTPRARGLRPAPAPAPKRTAAKKPAARRSRKAAASQVNGEIES